jgi:hypothetical protein
LRVYAALSELRRDDEDILGALLPFFEPILEVTNGKIFDPRVFAFGVQRLYRWRFTKDIPLSEFHLRGRTHCGKVPNLHHPRGGVVCQAATEAVVTFLLMVSFFVRPEGRFSVPTCPGPVTPRAAAVKDGRRPPPEAARSVLDGGEHGVTLGKVGTAAISTPWAL